MLWRRAVYITGAPSILDVSCGHVKNWEGSAAKDGKGGSYDKIEKPMAIPQKPD